LREERGDLTLIALRKSPEFAEKGNPRTQAEAYATRGDLSALAQYSRQYSRITAGMEDSHYEERFFLGRIGNQEIAKRKEPQRLRSQLLAMEAHFREIRQLLKRLPEFSHKYDQPHRDCRLR